MTRYLLLRPELTSCEVLSICSRQVVVGEVKKRVLGSRVDMSMAQYLLGCVFSRLVGMRL